MIQPPLLLERSFVTEVKVDANPDHEPGTTAVNVTVHQALAVLAEDATRWQVELDIVVDAQPGTPPPPYTIRIHTIGLFNFPGSDRLEEQKAHVLAVTGSSILYSQAREYLLMLTSRGPWGAFQLPTVSFADVGVATTAQPANKPSEGSGDKDVALEETKRPRNPRRRPAARRGTKP